MPAPGGGRGCPFGWSSHGSGTRAAVAFADGRHAPDTMPLPPLARPRAPRPAPGTVSPSPPPSARRGQQLVPHHARSPAAGAALRAPPDGPRQDSDVPPARLGRPRQGAGSASAAAATPSSATSRTGLMQGRPSEAHFPSRRTRLDLGWFSGVLAPQTIQDRWPWPPQPFRQEYPSSPDGRPRPIAPQRRRQYESRPTGCRSALHPPRRPEGWSLRLPVDLGGTDHWSPRDRLPGPDTKASIRAQGARPPRTTQSWARSPLRSREPRTANGPGAFGEHPRAMLAARRSDAWSELPASDPGRLCSGGQDRCAQRRCRRSLRPARYSSSHACGPWGVAPTVPARMAAARGLSLGLPSTPARPRTGQAES
jgi:hypothetical protein